MSGYGYPGLHATLAPLLPHHERLPEALAGLHLLAFAIVMLKRCLTLMAA